jgi:hypothetical protein
VDNTVRVWDAQTGATLQTPEGQSTRCILSFSDDGSFLVTDNGRVDITLLEPSELTGSSILVSSSSLLPYTAGCAGCSGGVFVQDEWIVYGSNRMLWLPPKYRPSCSVVYKNLVGLGCSSGHVWIFGFSF